jgi:hypothetical protein
MVDFSFFSGIPELAAFVPAYRAIGPVATPTGAAASNQQIPIIYADVTVEEEHRDELVITEHPVETGAAITDHAYKRPSQVVIRAGWSTSSGKATSITYPSDIRQQLISLQRSRLPFDLYTGKQAYSQMLIASLLTETTPDSEWALMATIVCQQILLVKTTTAPSNENMAALNPTKDQGSQSITPSTEFNTSNLYTMQDPITRKSLFQRDPITGLAFPQ